MTGFSKQWLHLREAADGRARNAQLLSHLHVPKSGIMRIVDLGTGTGSNLRYLAPRLETAQQWTLVDADSALLDSIIVPKVSAPLHITKRRLDLDKDLGALNFEGCTLVTASAFFDLVSEAWIVGLARKCALAKVPNALFFATVDGRISWKPEDSYDKEIRALFNTHMRRDKGFGPALGATAPAVLAREFEAAGYRVWSEESHWHLSAADAELQSQLLRGYLEAASEQDSDVSGKIGEWAQRRRAHIAGRQSELIVGHRDVMACLD